MECKRWAFNRRKFFFCSSCLHFFMYVNLNIRNGSVPTVLVLIMDLNSKLKGCNLEDEFSAST
jgi:hypothetical protein